ncbi:hypothetical protein NP233_g3672 [Leucocoprinus birnbaumii]|uniref:Protein LTV1 homolog n=1 Tax=Leucocoprinus birnbaumii TaxID=56174 RepID=A0AAD5VWS2_9AGAR|nr:hypothetical protein NP233_g3672 [Leucocoprinus birnbaumii]
MPPKKSIFRQPGAKHFQLVHRSQRDPLIHDPEASKHVLKPFERENVKKGGKSRADLESLLPISDVEHDKQKNVGEAALYGIYYDDTDYDYMQHLRTVGVQEEGVDSIMIEAPTKKNKGKAKMETLILPQESLPSASELPRNYESQQAIPESIAGFQPDMDPHLRQVLEALEDDAFVEDDLGDDFFGQLVDGGERGSEDVHFEFDEDGLEEVEDEFLPGTENESEPAELGWEERFAQFKKNQAREKPESTSDDEFASEGGDTIGGLPSISVIGGKGKKRRKGSSDASGYSMSSSSMYRNEALQTLDERFDQARLAPNMPNDADLDIDEAPELITSREDFDSMVNEFLNDYEILGRKMKPKLEGDSSIDKLDTIRRALGHDDRVRVNEDDDDEVQDFVSQDDTPQEDRWDCETILTTYSNLENHPRIIRVTNSRHVPKISLDPKTGFPLVDVLSNNQIRRTLPPEDDSDYDTETENTVNKRTTISRPRNESKDDKKARKAAAKAEKQNRRAEKRETKEQFAAELKTQKQVLANKAQRLKKLDLISSHHSLGMCNELLDIHAGHSSRLSSTTQCIYTPMPTTLTTFLLIATVLLVLTPTGTYAFGAGDIPDFSYLNDKAFRHGDIESILENLVKNAGGAALGGSGLLEFASSIINSASGGSKFSKMDVKRVYFGNWLRDYSQAMDISGLSKLAPDTITLIISVLGFMTFGFATREFEVTQERLGVYLPVEHIDNPKGYGEAEGDARRIHPKLRPPVQMRELEIDERTGMKKYMASENEGFDTSTACIRRTLTACIEYGRRGRGGENADQFEAFRLLGTGLHTLEDLLAHSNWCEIALRKMGHEEVFCHVGDNVIVDTPNGPAPPLVTGTFGGADFLHSLLGEAGDHLSQASVTDLAGKMDEASKGGDSNVSAFQAILGKLPIGGGNDKMNQTQEMQEEAKAYQFDPDNIAPPEVQRRLLDLLKWRDNIMRDVTETIEKIPGLSDLVESFENALNAFVYTILAPYLVPIITSVTGVLNEGSSAVINSDDQYRVFDDPDASDPSHSILSKDHFGLILNEPAGKIAQVVVEYSVNLIVRAWSDNSNPDRVVDAILEAFHHPYYADGRSQIQHRMFEQMEQWLGGLGSDEAQQVLERLTKESVREHKNKRIGSEDMDFEEPGYSHKPQNYSLGSQYASGGGAYNSGYSTSGGGGGGHRYDREDERSRESRHGQQQNTYGGGGYGRQENEYSGSRRDEDSYGGGYQRESNQAPKSIVVEEGTTNILIAARVVMRKSSNKEEIMKTTAPMVAQMTLVAMMAGTANPVVTKTVTAKGDITRTRTRTRMVAQTSTLVVTMKGTHPLMDKTSMALISAEMTIMDVGKSMPVRIAAVRVMAVVEALVKEAVVEMKVMAAADMVEARDTAGNLRNIGATKAMVVVLNNMEVKDMVKGRTIIQAMVKTRRSALNDSTSVTMGKSMEKRGITTTTIATITTMIEKLKKIDWI